MNKDVITSQKCLRSTSDKLTTLRDDTGTSVCLNSNLDLYWGINTPQSVYWVKEILNQKGKDFYLYDVK